MNAAALWRLFQLTGEPGYYVWYCRVRAEELTGVE